MFVFRADGNPTIGAGHIMRCLSIADATESPCLFVLADNELEEVIRNHGYGVRVLNTNFKSMEGELKIFFDILGSIQPTVLFVDSYFVSPDYMAALWKFCNHISCKLVYIDDILSFPYSCDILLNYNIYGSDKKSDYYNLYRKADMKLPQFLFGTTFVPLRKQFQNLPSRIIRKEAKNIFISTGGSDPNHITKRLVRYISICNELSKFCFHFVIGKMNEDKEEIQELTVGKSNIIIHNNVADMKGLMQACDIAISAAGSTLYELCATQTPTITYILADNQILGARGFEQRNILKCIGDARDFNDNEFIKHMLYTAVKLANDYNERARIADRQREIVDGNGAKRIVEKVKGTEIDAV